ncbi:MAG: MarR family transcriptional regulator [Coriobacteriia bacterium]|nr:MarR family transcriptional regulator [Coriobacteriia bacterium]
MAQNEQHKQLRELIHSLEQKTNALNNTQMTCCNITLSQCHALGEIGRAKEISLVELSEALGLENSTLSRTVNHLVDAEVAHRDTNPANRRSINISLTEEGQHIFDNIENCLNSHYEQLLQSIPADKRASVLESLQILLDAFAALEQSKAEPE